MMRKVRSNLRQILEARGMEQKQLAESTGIRAATISDLCRNESKMYPRQVLEKIADALGIDDMNELLSIENEKDAQ